MQQLEYVRNLVTHHRGSSRAVSASPPQPSSHLEALSVALGAVNLRQGLQRAFTGLVPGSRQW